MTILFRDNWTRGNFSPYIWVEGTPVIIQSPVTSGALAAKFTSTPTQMCYLQYDLASAIPDIHVGLFVILPSLMPLGETDVLAIIFSPLFDLGVSISIFRAADGTTYWQLNTPSGAYYQSAQPIQANTKYFVEVGKDSNGFIALWVNGVKVITTSVSASANWQHVQFGAMSNMAMTFDYEDFTVADSYIGSGAITGTLSVDTTPVKGEVFADGVSWGVAPQSRLVAAGIHTVAFGAIAGYPIPPSQTVNVTAGATTTVTGTYVPSTLTLTVNSTPINVQFNIIIGGMTVSYQTPYSASLDPGTYQIQMPSQIQIGSTIYNFNGWQDGDTNPIKNVVLNANIAIAATYVIAAIPQGTLYVLTNPVNGEVFLDGVSKGTSPVTLKLNPGTYFVSFGILNGYIAPVGQYATITSDAMTPVFGTYLEIPPFGGIVIDSIPFKVEVFLDRVSIGFTPIILPNVAVGSHIVSFPPVDGFTTPTPVVVYVAEGFMYQVNGVYKIAGAGFSSISALASLVGIGLIAFGGSAGGSAKTLKRKKR